MPLCSGRVGSPVPLKHGFSPDFADNALSKAYLAGRTTIDASDIERSASDLGIGRDPGSTYSQLSTASPVPPIMEPLMPTELSSLDLQASPASTDESPIDSETGSMPEFDLTPSMAIAQDPPPAATIDLDAGLEAAPEDFASEVSEASDLGEVSSDALILEDEPAVAVVEATGSATASDSPQEAEIVEVELAPIEAGDVFVELIEE